MSNFPVIIQQADNAIIPPPKARVSCRALIVEDSKILLSHETNGNVYMSPGGGLEKGESMEQCCAREVLEETGYVVDVITQFLTVDEYFDDTLFTSHYFICKTKSKGENALTPTEIDHGMEPSWVPIEEAVEIFSTYKSKTPDKHSLYLREFTVLNEYLKKGLG